METLEGVHRHRHVLQTAANGDDDAGYRVHETGHRHGRYTRYARRHQSAGEQPRERAQQPARVGEVHGTPGLSAGRQGCQIRVQATSVLVSPKLFK